MGEWISRAQLDVIENLAWEHGSVSVDHVKGDDSLVRVEWCVEGDWKNSVSVLDELGNVVYPPVELPECANIQIPLDLVTRIAGGKKVGQAMNDAEEHARFTGVTDHLEDFLGGFLGPRFVSELTGLMNELDARREDHAKAIEASEADTA